MRKRTWWVAIGALVALVVVGGVTAAQNTDWGLKIEKQTSDKTKDLFGVGSALSSTSTTSLTEAQALANPAALVTVSKGLKVSVVAAGPDDNVGSNADQMVLWPPSN